MHKTDISIWFFIGVLLTIYGAMMLVLGLFYGVRFRPRRND